jgi:putative molybdopterin biosynthesis protein
MKANRVREVREARGLSQVALAEAARLTRQSIGAIEAGRATPAVDVALRVARALECHVEELFGAGPLEPGVWAEAGAAAVSGRVLLAEIAGRWVAHPLAREGVGHAADGLVVARKGGKLEIEPLRPAAEARDNLVIMGCALALGLLADRLNARSGAGRFVWLPRASTPALDALSRAQTHLAGVHLVDAKTGEANPADMRKYAREHPLSVIALGRWEAGIVVPSGNPKRIRAAADLGRRGLRLVARESGSGAQRLLLRELHRAGLSPELARGAHACAAGHLEVAQIIALGAADAGVATRDAALAYDLDFIPLAEERYDLVLSQAALADPRSHRLFDTLTSAGFRRELSSLGYDMSVCGERVAEIAAS